MEYGQDLLDWIASADWQSFGRVAKGLLDIKEMIVLAFAAITSITLLFVKQNLKRTVNDIRSEIGSIKKQLSDSSEEFRGELEGDLNKLNSSMKTMLEQLDDDLGSKFANWNKFNLLALDQLREDVPTPRTEGENLSSTAFDAESADENWNELNQLWAETKKELDVQKALVIARSGKRRAKKYSELDKRSYETIIVTLSDDKYIKDEVAAALFEMNLLYNSRRNQKRPVSEEDLKKFKEWRKIWRDSDQVNMPLAAE